MIEKLDGLSMDIETTNKEKLQTVFPECFNDGKLDIDKLLALCGEYISDDFEKYEFKWKGKSDCLRLAQKRSTATLRPCPKESVNFDTTQNLYIEGDNLEVLKLLQKSYYNSVKMIYIDPPYNTGHDFVYEDDYADPMCKYLEVTKQTTKSNPETMGRYHTNWLNMMYPRLRLAANLLQDDGVIFISIDDNEVHNLRKICDEVFGEENFVAQLVWEKKKKGSFLSGAITTIKEYIVVYCNNLSSFEGLIGEINSDVETYPCINADNKREKRIIQAGISSKYKEKNFFMPKGSEISDTTMSLILCSDLVIENGCLAKDLVIEGNWRYSQEKMSEYAQNKEIYITRDLYLRRIVTDTRYKTLKDILLRKGEDEETSIKDIVNLQNLNDSGWGSNEDADEELRLLLGAQKLLDYPKPIRLIYKLIASFRNSKDAIILDCFSGSATTAHAVMQLNADDGGNRKFIMVQLPEKCDEDKAAYKAGYANICEIGKERIRLAGKQILENANLATKPDIGFKVLKLDTSNMQMWDDTPVSDDDLDRLLARLHGSINTIKPNRSDLDLIYEILLKLGYPLTSKISTLCIDNLTVYSIDDNSMIISLQYGITIKHIEKMLSYKPQKIVLVENSLPDNSVMSNAHYLLENNGVELKII